MDKTNIALTFIKNKKLVTRNTDRKFIDPVCFIIIFIYSLAISDLEQIISVIKANTLVLQFV